MCPVVSAGEWIAAGHAAIPQHRWAGRGCNAKCVAFDKLLSPEKKSDWARSVLLMLRESSTQLGPGEREQEMPPTPSHKCGNSSCCCCCVCVTLPAEWLLGFCCFILVLRQGWGFWSIIPSPGALTAPALPRFYEMPFQLLTCAL